MTRIIVSHVEISRKFATSSQRFGFGSEVLDSYEDDILDLQELWERQKFVAVCDAVHRRPVWGMVKDSDADPGAIPDYTGLYHGRLLKDENDPLIIVTFCHAIVPGQRYEACVIEAMIDHDLMFMPYGQKTPANKKIQRKWVRSVLSNEQ